MLVTKVKLVTVLLGLTLCLAGGGVLAYQALAVNATEPPQPAGESRREVEAPRQPGAIAQVDCYGDPLPVHALARMGTTRLYHGQKSWYPSTDFAFSPDSKMLATLMDGRMTVCLWDAATGKEIHRLTTKAVTEPIASLVLSPDSKTLVTVNWDRTVRFCFWEMPTGKFLRKQDYQEVPNRDNLEGPKVAFLPDGRMLGFGDFLKYDEKGKRIKEVCVWDVNTGKEICQLNRPLKEGEGGRRFTAFSPDGKMLATVLNVKTKAMISLWDVTTGKEIRGLTYRDGSVNTVALSTDGKMLAVGGREKICVWEVTTGKKIHRFQPKEEETWLDCPLAFSSDGKTLAGGGVGAVHLWEVATGKEIRSFASESAVAAHFSPDGKVLALGDRAGTIRLWEVATGKEIGPRKGYRGCIHSVAYSPNGKTLASINGDTVRLWEVATGKEMRPLTKCDDLGRSLAYSPDGKMLAFTDTMGMHLWDTATGKEIRQFKIPDKFINTVHWLRSATFSPDGKFLAATGGHGMVFLWQVATGRRVYTLMEERLMGTEVPWLVVFSPDGRLLGAPGRQNTVSLWEVATGEPIGHLAGPKLPTEQEDGLIWDMAFSPDGRMLATSNGRDDKVCLWEVASGKKIGQLGLKPHCVNEAGGYVLAFSPDGRMLVTAAQCRAYNRYDPVVHLWEVASGKEIGQLTGHQDAIRTIVFSPDGKTLASGSEDTTCLVWDVTPFVGRLKPALAPRLVPQILSPKRLEAAWADLAKDPAQAYTAVRALQAVPAQAIPLLRGRIPPVAPVADPKQLQRWIADLDNNSFTVRDKAQREIEKLGEVAVPALRQALKDQSALELGAKRRLQALLAELEPKGIVVSPYRLRELRAVQVLESVGTAEAQQVLQAWAKGVPRARLTMAAEAALARLTKRAASKP